VGRSATWALIAACAFSACASADSQGGVSSSSTAPRTTPTTFDRAAEEAAVIAAYLAEIDAFYLAANPPNPNHPALAETATGDLLEGLRQNLEDLAQEGTGIRRGAQTTDHPRVTRIAPGAAIVEDCGVDGDVQFNVATGVIVDDSVITGKATARLIKVRDRWLVAEKTFEVDTCA